MNPIFKNKSDLEVIEAYAWEAAAISSEAHLSEVFDQHIENSPMDTKDKPALRQEFNDWKHQMHKDGYIHQVQLQNYSYVGELFEN